MMPGRSRRKRKNMFPFIRILLMAAVIPAMVLLKYVYDHDHLEKEPPAMLLKLIFLGVISTLMAMAGEWIGSTILDNILPPDNFIYRFLMFFIVVGVSEELSKYIVLKRRTWNDPNFNCLFDGIIYAVFVSLGFALWENIQYVFSYGLGTALIRAVTAIPGHACFGVFMGFYYGLARKYENYGRSSEAFVYRALSVTVPVLLHGLYDYVATSGTTFGAIVFYAFIAVLFFGAFRIVKNVSAKDHFIQ